MPKAAPFEINGETIAPGSRRTVGVPVSVLSDHTPVSMSVHVIHGRQKGPTVFISGGIHGDEIIGVEIIRRILATKSMSSLKGTLLAVPVVNAYGLINHSRYLPDRRDLNRVFPGNDTGSLAARLAERFLTEVVKRSDLGIDLHSAAVHRTNYPQVRVSPGDTEMATLAEIFGAPVVMTSVLREGSLRHAGKEIGKPIVFNICMLGTLIGLTELVKPESILKVLETTIPKDFMDMNKKALELGMELGASKA